LSEWGNNRDRWAVDRLLPYARNARTHSPAQVDQIAASMREWGWTNPVLADEAGMIIAALLFVRAHFVAELLPDQSGQRPADAVRLRSGRRLQLGQRGALEAAMEPRAPAGPSRA
jgi:hypothetical protein